jgi:hypothetical protein
MGSTRVLAVVSIVLGVAAIALPYFFGTLAVMALGGVQANTMVPFISRVATANTQPRADPTESGRPGMDEPRSQGRKTPPMVIRATAREARDRTSACRRSSPRACLDQPESL